MTERISSVDRKEQEKQPIEAVIFDKDGVLINTERVHYEAWYEAITFFGGQNTYDWNSHLSYAGMPTIDRFAINKEIYSINATEEEFLGRFRDNYTAAFDENGIEVFEGVREFIDNLRQSGIKYAVASGARRINIEMTLSKAGLLDRFDIYVGTDDVEKGKPNPDLFLEAANRLGVDPSRCLVIGDTVNDVLGARAAGMRAVAVSDPHNLGAFEEIKPNLVIESLKGLILEDFKNL